MLLFRIFSSPEKKKIEFTTLTTLFLVERWTKNDKLKKNI